MRLTAKQLPEKSSGFRVQRVVEREVGNLEAARAEHADDLVLIDAVARRQRVQMVLRHERQSYYGAACSAFATFAGGSQEFFAG